MNYRALLRSGPVRLAPFALGITWFYFFVSQREQYFPDYGYAPTIVSLFLEPVYALSYAIASGLAAWESGRLTDGKIWDIAPVRSQFRIAANALAPVVILSWMMLILPVGGALAIKSVAPTLDSLRPLFQGLVLCAAHAVIGFTVGRYVSGWIAAPLLLAGVFVLVAFSVTTTPFWYRNVSGQYRDILNFGEVISINAMLPHFLFTGSIAVAALVLWVKAGPKFARIGLAGVLAISGITTAHKMASGWGPSGPVVTGQAPMICEGRKPKVCLPEATSSHLPDTQRSIRLVLARLQDAGIEEAPTIVTDRLADGRDQRASTSRIWRVNLTRAAEEGKVRYAIVLAAARFSCDQPDPAKRREAILWVATVAGEVEEYKSYFRAMGEEFETDKNRVARVDAVVNEVLGKPKKIQSAWFKDTLVTACQVDS